MNRKAGLQKKVSSIFDETEAPSESVLSALAGRTDPGQGAGRDKSERVVTGGTSLASSAANEVEGAVVVPTPPVSQEAKFFKSIPSAGKQKKLKMIVLAGVLTVVLGGMIVRSFVSGSAKKNDVKRAISAKEIADAISKDAVVKWSVPGEVGKNIRDVTVAGGRSASYASTGILVVRGILLSEDNNSAIIGKCIVHTGEQIAGVTVVGITRKTVEFEKNGKRWVQQIEK